ncbi:outer membrane protein [Cetobacterium sp.]|uniref:outer membrane protein n=1 Tax=Cetobacterium sp. TaxID=2071632 RepID=UPI003F31DAEB
MKKLALLACSLFVLTTVAQAKEVVRPVTSSKEVMREPVTSSKEVVNEPVVLEEVVVPAVANPWGYINLRGGWDFWSEYEGLTVDSIPLLSNKTKDFGGEVALEAYKAWDNFDLGLGVAYQDHTNRKTLTDEFGDSLDGAEYKSVPLYVTGKYKINYWDWAVTPYVKANIGYSFNFDSDSIKENFEGEHYSYGTSVDDGLYWAAGLGMEYQAFNIDILYGETQAKTKVNGENVKFDNDYKRVTLSVGYRFNIW